MRAERTSTTAILLLFLTPTMEARAACGHPQYKPPSGISSKCSGGCLTINPILGEMLQKNLEAIGGNGIIITSGCRSSGQNSKLAGASSGSNHLHGDAVDSVPANGNCPAYKAAAEKANNRVFITCFHGTGPHLHMDARGGPPCQNCDKKGDYGRQPEQAGGGAPSGGGGSPSGGGGSPSGGGQPPSGQSPSTITQSPVSSAARFLAGNRGSKDWFDKAIDVGSRAKDTGAKDKGNIAGKEPDPGSQITRTGDNFSPGSYSPSESGSAQGSRGTACTGGAASAAVGSVGGGSGAGLGLGGLGSGDGGSVLASSLPSQSGGGSSYGSGGGGGGGGGGYSSSSGESLSPFRKKLDGGGMSLSGSEVSAATKAFAEDMGLSKDGRLLGELNLTEADSLFSRMHLFYENCQRRGCVEAWNGQK